MHEIFKKPWGRFKAGDKPDKLVLADRLRLEQLRKDGYLGTPENEPTAEPVLKRKKAAI